MGDATDAKAGEVEDPQDVRTVTKHGTQPHRPTSTSSVSTVREWVAVFARYTWTWPLVYRVAGVVVAVYTIVAAVDGKYALVRWLFGLFLALFGWGLTRTARRLSASDLERDRRRRMANLEAWPIWAFDQLFGRLPLAFARRTEFVMGAILIAAGAALAVGSVLAL